jgi:hypothetical protein
MRRRTERTEVKLISRRDKKINEVFNWTALKGFSRREKRKHKRRRQRTRGSMETSWFSVSLEQRIHKGEAVVRETDFRESINIRIASD